MTPENSVEMSPWEIRQNVHPLSVIALLECLAEIAYALEEFVQIARQHTSSSVLLLAKTRQISVPLRKILLDGNGGMLKRCIKNPEIHPMKAPADDAKTFRATQSLKEQQFVLNYADGSSSTLKIPAHDYVVSVHPLFGITHESESRSILTTPFDFVTRTVKFNKWMNTKILEVNGMQFDARSILHLMVVKEGAHTNERLPMMGAVLPDEDSDTRYSAIDGIKFGVFSYMQFFALYVGLYLVSRIREALEFEAFRIEHPRFEEVCDLIHQYPANFPHFINCTVSVATNPFYVLGENDELVGDYSQGVATTMRIPED